MAAVLDPLPLALPSPMPRQRLVHSTRPGLPHIAVVIPCYNEELTVAEVVRQFHAELPDADIYVFDNNSTDSTVERARRAGARVCFEYRQGKGYVVQSMFRQVDADIFVMVDGDGTYPAAVVETLIEPILSGKADMVIGSRLQETCDSEFRLLNRLGNNLFLLLLNFIFRVRLTDLLSGYRAFSCRLVRCLPLFAGGFETETELTIKVLQRGFSIVEVPVNLGQRPDGSHSKIRVVHDGLAILGTILGLFRDYKPLTFFGALGLGLIALSLLPGGWAAAEYIQTRHLYRLPSAVLAVGLGLTGVVSVLVGVILHTIAHRFQELDLQLQRLGEDMRHSLGLDMPR